MSKEYASVPLSEMNAGHGTSEAKPGRPKTKCTNSLVFKLVFLVLICILIVLLITTLAVIISRPYRDPCPIPQTSTESPRPTSPPRIPNKYWNEYFLPPFIIPTHYNLTLQLLNSTYDILKYNQTNAFYGHVNVYFQVNSTTNFVVLHSSRLTIKSIILKENVESKLNPVDVKINEIITDGFYNYLILIFSQQLVNGKQYVLDINFSGLTTYDDSGIITTTYYDVDAKKRYYLLYSKLEPIGARKIFPCFDEPDKKITFTVTIIHEKRYLALSNMPIVAKSRFDVSQLLFNETNWNQTLPLEISRFNSTEVPMSVYLLAFVLIENYGFKETTREPNKTVRIWFPNDLQSTADIPLTYSRETENFFERYFNYSSPLPKTDHIYMPDFLSGAMENWGLITYRDKHLLVFPGSTVQQSKTSLKTIAHELAHFWFGNWVTSKTWGEIWLNEGFATYFASFAYYSQLNMEIEKSNSIFLNERRQVMNKDNKPLSSIITNVTDPATFRLVFNPMVYEKGQALLAWLESLMGSSGFHKAIQAYIKKFAGKNPTNAEFFDVMDEVGPAKGDIPKLKEFFKPWLYKSGYPIVTVNYDIEKKTMILTQQSNLANSSALEKWPIHTTYKIGNTIEDTSIYFNDKKVVDLPLEENQFVILNSNGKSYIRVNYSEYLWHRIINDLKSSTSQINLINKIVLFDDAFSFAEFNNINVSITKGLVDSLMNETNFIPWWIFYVRIFDKLQDLFKDDILFIKFRDMVIKLSKPILEKVLAINPNNVMDSLEEISQKCILMMNCEANNDAALNWMSQRFTGWIKNPTGTTLPKHLMSMILYYGMKTNDKERHWMKMWQMLKGKPENYGSYLTPGEIAVGLAGTSKPYYLNRLLDHFLIPNSHRSINDKQQDFGSVIEWMTQTTNGWMVAQRWLVANANKAMEFAFGDNISPKDQAAFMESLLNKLCRTVYEPILIQPFLNLTKKAFLVRNSVQINRSWRNTVGKTLIEYL